MSFCSKSKWTNYGQSTKRCLLYIGHLLPNQIKVEESWKIKFVLYWLVSCSFDAYIKYNLVGNILDQNGILCLHVYNLMGVFHWNRPYNYRIGCKVVESETKQQKCPQNAGLVTSFRQDIDHTGFFGTGSQPDLSLGSFASQQDGKLPRQAINL